MEEMALESLVASVWKLEGFVSVTRYPVRVDGGYSDIDVLGVSGDGKIRLAECKARGPARCVNIEGKEHSSDSKRRWTERWGKSLENVGRIWEPELRPPWFPSKYSSIKQFEFHLVGNVWFVDDEARRAAEERLTAKVRQLVPSKIRKVSGRVFPSVKLLTNAISLVKQDIVGEKKWGKRYGDPHLDAIRELVRYAHPVPKGASGARAAIAESLKKELLESLFNKP